MKTKASFSLDKRSNLNKWVLQALMSVSTSSHYTKRLTQLWRSEPKKRVKEEMMGGKIGGKKTGSSNPDKAKPHPKERGKKPSLHLMFLNKKMFSSCFAAEDRR